MRRDTMRTNRTMALTASAMALLAGTAAVNAAEVSFERLRNPEPRNWLMNHGDYNAHRFSPLDRINRSNVRNLRFAFSVAVGRNGGNENLLSPPVDANGFIY